MNIIQELGLVETVLGDVASFAAGQPVSTTVPGTNYTASVQVLPNGPVAPYQELSGSIFSIIGTVLADAAAFAEGAPVSLAVKENKTWYGLTLATKVPVPAEPTQPAQ